MKTNTYNMGSIDEKMLKYAVITTKYCDRWVLVKHKERDTWELPGGTREVGENITMTAKRELFEETGASVFSMKPIFDYSVENEKDINYGRVFFSEIEKLSDIQGFEIECVDFFDKIPNDLTYPEIYSTLLEKINDYLN